MDKEKQNNEFERIEYALEKLADALLQYLPEPMVAPAPIPDVFMARRDQVGESEHRFDKPLVSLLVQGSKEIIVGTDEYSLRPGQLLAVGMDMPSSSRITNASQSAPLLTFYFHINHQIINELIFELKWKPYHVHNSRGASVTSADVDFVESMLRLARIFEKPEQIPVRSDLALRDLHYLLMTGKQADVLSNFYGAGSAGTQIFAAIRYLRDHNTSHVKAADVSDAANMSESTLYRHFKELTGLSPLQYHKHLRLHEARRLIMADGSQIADAAYKVGYESVSQFIREYKKLFGYPPKKSKRPQAN